MRVVTTDAAIFLEVPQGWLVKMTGCTDSTFITDPDHTWPYTAVTPSPMPGPTPVPVPIPAPMPVPVPVPIPPPMPPPAPVPLPVPVPVPAPSPVPLPAPTPMPLPVPAPSPSPGIGFEGTTKEVVFDGILAKNWFNYSWATQSIIRDPAGALAIQTDLSDFKGENLHSSVTKNLQDYAGISFDCEELVVGGSYRVSLYDGTNMLGIGKMVTPAASYATFQFTLQDMGIPSTGTFTNIVMEGVSQGMRSSFLIKNINLWKHNGSIPAPMPMPTPMPVPVPMPAPAPMPVPSMTAAPATMGALTIDAQGKFHDASGAIWFGKGVNVPDAKLFNAGAGLPIAAAFGEIKRRTTFAVQTLQINFLRFCIHEDAGVQVQPTEWWDALKDYVTWCWNTYGIRVLLSFWREGTLKTITQAVTAASIPAWQMMTKAFANSQHVIFALSNEPQNPSDASADWIAFNNCCMAIRAQEQMSGVMTPHVIAVQGLGGWARNIAAYQNKHITAPGPIAYGVHTYDHSDVWTTEFVQESQSGMAVIAEEFGPAVIQGMANTADYNNLNLADSMYWSLPREQAPLFALFKANDIPCCAWALSIRAWPDLLKDNSNGGAGVGMMLELTDWGKILRSLYTA